MNPRRAHNPEVAGSSPAPATKKMGYWLIHRHSGLLARVNQELLVVMALPTYIPIADAAEKYGYDPTILTS